jgi:hypothetical protein
MIKTLTGEVKKIHFGLADIEQLSGRVALTHDPKKPAPNRSLSLSLSSIRLAKDFDWVKQLKEWSTAWKEHAHGAAKYYSGTVTFPALGFKDTTVWFYLPDSRTAVIESEANIKALIDNQGKAPAQAWGKDWEAVEGGMFGLALTDVKGKLAKKLPAEKADSPEVASLTNGLGAVFGKSRTAVVGLDLGDRLDLKLLIACENPTDAEGIHGECIDILASVRKMTDRDTTEPKTELEKLGRKLSSEMIESTQISNRIGDDRVSVWIRTKTGIAEFLKAFAAAGGK